MTQGDPLAIIAYGIGVPPLIRELWGAHPRVTHTWYADDAGSGGTFQQILDHFRDLQARGPARGYYLEPNKRILVVSPWNVHRKEAHFKDKGVHMVTRNRYIGDQESEKEYMAEKLTG